MRERFRTENLTRPLPAGIDLGMLAIPPSQATGLLHEGNRIDLGNRTLEVLHSPGHSPGGIVLLDQAHGILFSTDVAYAGHLYIYGREALGTYRQTLDRLAALAPNLSVLYPSHGPASISPSLLSQMADLVGRVINGEQPSSVNGDVAVYDDDGVGVYLFPPRQ